MHQTRPAALPRVPDLLGTKQFPVHFAGFLFSSVDVRGIHVNSCLTREDDRAFRLLAGYHPDESI